MMNKRRSQAIIPSLDKKDVIYSFLGSFLFCLIFIVSGSVINLAKQFSWDKILLILLVSFLLLCFKVFVNSYRKLKMKHDVKFFEILAARLVIYATITVVVTAYIIYIFSPLFSLSLSGLIKLGIIVSFPAAIGSMLPLLIKEF